MRSEWLTDEQAFLLGYYFIRACYPLTFIVLTIWLPVEAGIKVESAWVGKALSAALLTLLLGPIVTWAVATLAQGIGYLLILWHSLTAPDPKTLPAVLDPGFAQRWDELEGLAPKQRYRMAIRQRRQRP